MTHHILRLTLNGELRCDLGGDISSRTLRFYPRKDPSRGYSRFAGLLGQCFKYLEPGGKVEISEGRANFFCDDDSLPEDTATYRWLTEFRLPATPPGYDIAPQIPDMLKDAGFVDVAYTQKVVPLGTWPKDPALKEVGQWFRVQFLGMALEAYSLALFTRMGGWSNDDVRVLFTTARDELRTNRIHLYTYTAFITGTKHVDGVSRQDFGSDSCVEWQAMTKPIGLLELPNPVAITYTYETGILTTYLDE
ncbi:methyltransferase [Metarhizium acridum CQMa 102]|uniref:Methyltransferase n=1 Tax=Metarhizium acridum (strain CQMa 102) TaxID=655827 RepID=E9DVT0_METAQ|nr:methyltransferase [Metarhizium acridum CQMa 102]EFY92127.1 methyltransferase [Metarhizium acridum CQMa 102]